MFSTECRDTMTTEPSVRSATAMNLVMDISVLRAPLVRWVLINHHHFITQMLIMTTILLRLSPRLPAERQCTWLSARMTLRLVSVQR